MSNGTYFSVNFISTILPEKKTPVGEGADFVSALICCFWMYIK